MSSLSSLFQLRIIGCFLFFQQGFGICETLFCCTFQDIHDKISRIVGELDRVQEKMYDFEINKKNNLIFYGIPNEINEKEPYLIQKVKELIRNHMKIRRDIIITSATR